MGSAAKGWIIGSRWEAIRYTKYGFLSVKCCSARS